MTPRQSGEGLRERGIVPFLAMRNTEHGSGLGRWRWVQVACEVSDERVRSVMKWCYCFRHGDIALEELERKASL